VNIEDGNADASAELKQLSPTAPLEHHSQPDLLVVHELLLLRLSQEFDARNA
jgi:hypothetical protein